MNRCLAIRATRRARQLLIDDKVGDKRLRAGLPSSWRIGDKTGTGDRGSTNAVAILWPPPERAPLIATVYYTESSAPIDARNAIHQEIGGLIAETFS
jgi:beta-lactamase class A